MTSPPRRITVRCPNCSTEFKAWHRPSINLTLGESWTDEEIREATSATCPECGYVIALDTILVSADGWVTA